MLSNNPKACQTESPQATRISHCLPCAAPSTGERGGLSGTTCLSLRAFSRAQASCCATRHARSAQGSFSRLHAKNRAHLVNPGAAFFLVTFFLAAQEKVTRQRRNRMRKSEFDNGNRPLNVVPVNRGTTYKVIAMIYFAHTLLRIHNLNGRKLSRMIFRFLRNEHCRFAGDFTINFSHFSVWIGHHCRPAAIGLQTNFAV
jgi:hypothetical protein